MANWCQHCEGNYPRYYCRISDNRNSVLSSFMVDNYCKNNAYKCPIYAKNGTNSAGCFITTVACEILNKKDDNEVMQNLRKFRDNVLQENEEYFDVLKEYDTVGPVLADRLRNDENREVIAETLYEKILKPISVLVSEDKIEKAVESYYVMTLLLVNYYGLKHDYNNVKENGYYYESFDSKTAGHGKKLEMVLKKESNN